MTPNLTSRYLGATGGSSDKDTRVVIPLSTNHPSYPGWGGSAVRSALCLELLKPNVARTQKVVLHCFTGAQEVVISWCKAFPNCFFSYSGQARLFTEAQKQAVRRVPANRLLIETDSPYFRPAGARMCTPSFFRGRRQRDCVISG